MTVQEGSPAPHFRLLDQYGAAVDLDTYSDGWKLVWWLPSTLVEHASGCGDRIASGFAQHAAQAPELAVLGLSFDDQQQSREFARRATITFPMLTADIETGRAYGVYRENDEWSCFPRKRAFLVAPDGLVAKVYTNIDPDFFVHEVLADMEDLRRHRGVFQRVLTALKG